MQGQSTGYHEVGLCPSVSLMQVFPVVWGYCCLSKCWDHSVADDLSCNQQVWLHSLKFQVAQCSTL